MIITRIALLILRLRQSSITTGEMHELYEWVTQRFEHFVLLQEMTNDEFLHKACAIIMEGDRKGNWKKIEQKIFQTLSDTTATKPDFSLNRNYEVDKPLSKAE